MPKDAEFCFIMANYNSHCFSVELATTIGLREAILLQYFYHWHLGNKDNPAMQIEGRTWFYISAAKIAATFPYFSDKQVRTIIDHLVELGVLAKGNHAVNQMLRTAWYSLTDIAINFFDFSETANAFSQMGKSSDQTGKCKSYNNNLNNTSTNVESIDIIRAGRFVKPSMEEIASYCRERQNSVDAGAFFDFYESKGWKVGNQPMKDWKAAVRTWERGRNNSRKPSPHPAAPPSRTASPDHYDFSKDW